MYIAVVDGSDGGGVCVARILLFAEVLFICWQLLCVLLLRPSIISILFDIEVNRLILEFL